MRRILASIGLLASIITGMAAQQFSLKGEYRSRLAVNHGYKVPVKQGTDPLFSVDQRTRLSFSYSGNLISTCFTLQDARIWGGDNLYNTTGTSGNSESFGIHEAWAQVSLSEYANIRVGRQEWNYDDMRILSPRNWWTSGLSYDALLFRYAGRDNGLALDLGMSYNNNGSSTGMVDNSNWPAEKIKTLNFIHARGLPGNKSSIAFIVAHSGMIDTSNTRLVSKGTFGLLSTYNMGETKTKGIFARLSAYYQLGRDVKKGSDGRAMKVGAYLVGAEAGLRTYNKQIEVIAGFDLISGRDDSRTGTGYLNTRHSFDMLYGARFPYYGGNLNHFILQDSHKTGTKGGAYFDPYIRIKSTLNQRSIVEVGYYMPFLSTKVLAHEYIDPVSGKPSGSISDASGKPVYWQGLLGHYVDIKYTCKLRKELVLKAGISCGNISDMRNQMVFGYKDPETSQLFKSTLNYFSWVALIVRPTLFLK